MSQKNDSRSRLLRTASRLFQVQGYHATGLNQIVKESKAPKGSLYYYFPGGKEELAVEAINITAKQVHDHLASHLRSKDPVKGVQSILIHIADKLDQLDKDTDEMEGVPIGLLALETWHMSERLRQACAVAFDTWQKMITEKLTENGLSAEEAQEKAVVIHSMLEGALTLCVTKKSSAPLRSVIDHIPLLFTQSDAPETE